MNKIYLILIIAALFCIPVAYSATRDYNYEVEIDANFSSNGSIKSIGNIIFYSQIVDSEVIVISNINNSYGNLNGTKFDVLEVSGQNSVKLKLLPDGEEISLIPGGIYEFTTAGIYKVWKFIDDNVTGTIDIKEINDITLNLGIDCLADLTLNQSSLILGEEDSIQIISNISQNFPSGDYDLKINVQNNGEVKIISGTFHRDEVKVFELVEDNMANGTVKMGEVGEFGFIKLRNVGNVQFSVIINISDYDDILSYTSPVSLYPGLDIKIPVFYSISHSTELGDRNGTLKITNNNQVWDKKLSINIADSINPTIFNISFEGDKFIKERITTLVIADDNENIANVTCKWDNLTIVLGEDGKFYRGSLLFDNVGVKNLRYCVRDTSNNTNCTTMSINVTKQNYINYTETVKLPSTRYNKFSEGVIFNVSKPMVITIKLVDINYEGNYTMRIEDGRGVEQYIEGRGGKVTIDNSGQVRIGIMGRTEGEFSGILLITVPLSHESIGRITFSGKVLDYDIPAPIHQEWFGSWLDCDVEDTGQFETSKIKCKIDFPISADLDNTILPVTPEGKETLMFSHKQEIDTLSDRVIGKNIIIGCLIFLSIMLIALLIFMVRIHPILRWKVI